MARMAVVVLALWALVRAQAPMPVTVTMTLMPVVDVFYVPAQGYTLAKTPAPNTRAMVYVNGLLMCEQCGTDYTLAGTALTFTGQRVSEMETPVVVQVWYWVAQ